MTSPVEWYIYKASTTWSIQDQERLEKDLKVNE